MLELTIKVHWPIIIIGARDATIILWWSESLEATIILACCKSSYGFVTLLSFTVFFFWSLNSEFIFFFIRFQQHMHDFHPGDHLDMLHQDHDPIQWSLDTQVVMTICLEKLSSQKHGHFYKVGKQKMYKNIALVAMCHFWILPEIVFH